ncbi:MAG: DedA family protein [Bdellovibrionales bacterium]
MLSEFVDVFLNLDTHLAQMAQSMGPWLYLLLFAIIFTETGLVIMPFLPGDSLLFAAGALCAVEGTGLNVHLIAALLIVAGILGDAVNYSVGRFMGPKIFTSETSLLINKKHLLKTQAFYEKHGPFTIVVARFAPIIRTFAPFVAGIGQMRYPRFAIYNVAGAFAWVLSFTYGGYFFGNLPVIKRNFHIVIVAIIILSLMPMVVEFLRQRRQTQS